MLILLSCARVTVVADRWQSTGEAPPDVQIRKNFYFFGIAPEYDLRLADYCKTKRADKILILRTGNDVLLGVITLGIYMPKTVRIWCAGDVQDDAPGGME